MTSHRVASAGAVLDVFVRPGAPTVVLLHGLAGYWGEWSAVIERLDSHLGVIALDQRGHGASFDANHQIDVSRGAFVADVVTLVDEFAEGPVVLVGQSMGGVVATFLAAARPDLVAHLVLVEVGMGAMTEAGLASLQRWFDTWPDQFADDAAASDFFGADAPSTSAWVDGLHRTPAGLVGRFDPSQLMASMRSLAVEDRWAQWESLDGPTTIIRAAEGTMSDVDVDRMLVTHPAADLVVIANSGHDVHLDQPDAVAAIVNACCSTHPC